jgi:phosphatidylinositol 3-kinase
LPFSVRASHRELLSSQLEGTRRPPSHTELLEKPELRSHGIAQAPYVSRMVGARTRAGQPFLQEAVRPLRDLPARRRQQTAHDPLPDVFQGVQECVHVRAFIATTFPNRLRNSWNEWITLPVRYCDLPLNAQVTFTVWDIAGPRTPTPVGGSTFRLFGKKWYVLLR